MKLGCSPKVVGLVHVGHSPIGFEGVVESCSQEGIEECCLLWGMAFGISFLGSWFSIFCVR